MRTFDVVGVEGDVAVGVRAADEGGVAVEDRADPGADTPPTEDVVAHLLDEPVVTHLRGKIHSDDGDTKARARVCVCVCECECEWWGGGHLKYLDLLN